MKKLLAPVDFSAVSVNAAKYAANLAIDLDLDLHLIHVVQVAVIYGDVPVPIGEYEGIQTEAQQDMKALIGKLLIEAGTNLRVSGDVYPGSPVFELIRQSQQPDVYAMVMGTHGAGSVERFLLGSTTESLVREAACPVFIIPSGYIYHKPKAVGLATDLVDVVHHTPDKAILKIVADMGAHLDILHCDPDFGENEPEVMQEELMLENMFHRQNPTFHFLHGEVPEESVMEYARQKAIDLVFIIEKKHGFLASLFRHKHTGRFVRNAAIPLCVVKQAKST